MAKGVVYGAEITDLATGNKETYTGLTDSTMRDRIRKHEGDCRLRDRPGTKLSAHVFEFKDKGHTYTITWQILARASSYNPSSGMCRWSQAGLVDGSLPHAC